MPKAIGFALALFATAMLWADALREAAQALENNEYAGAIPHLEAALQEDPSNVNARFNLAYAQQATGDDAGAIEHYALITEQQPDLVQARQNLATLLMRSARFQEAAREYEAIAAAKPEDEAARMLLAIAHRQAGNVSSAAEAFRGVLEHDSSSLDALLGLAGSLAELGQLHQAVPHYLRAAEIEPRADSALLEIAKRLEAGGHRQDALELYRRHARKHPDDDTWQEEIGIMLLEDGNLRAATRALERAIDLAPQPQRHAALAEAYRRAGNTDAAREQIRLSAAAAPADANARLRYANSLLQQQAYERAAQEYLAACEADPSLRDAWNGLAFAMYQLSNFPAALRALSEAAKLGSPQPASVYLKALCQDNLQLYEEAQSTYRAFLAMTPAMQDEAWKASERLRAIGKVLEKR